MRRIKRKKPRKTIVKLPIGNLKPHAARRVPEPSNRDVRLLAANMAKYGQRTSLHVLSDGNVLDGLRRLRAAQLLGWTDLRCIVRTDLEGAPEAVDRFLIDHALRSRALSKPQREQCGRQLRELDEAERNRQSQRWASDLTEIANLRTQRNPR